MYFPTGGGNALNSVGLKFQSVGGDRPRLCPSRHSSSSAMVRAPRAPVAVPPARSRTHPRPWTTEPWPLPLDRQRWLPVRRGLRKDGRQSQPVSC